MAAQICDGGSQQVTEIGCGDFVLVVKGCRSGDLTRGECLVNDREPNLSSEMGLTSNGCNSQLHATATVAKNVPWPTIVIGIWAVIILPPNISPTSFLNGTERFPRNWKCKLILHHLSDGRKSLKKRRSWSSDSINIVKRCRMVISM